MVRAQVFALGLALVGAPFTPILATEPSDRATLDGDMATLRSVMAATGTRGFAAIHERLGDLETILKHAPQAFQPVETGEGATVVRVVDMSQCLIALAAVGEAMKRSGHGGGKAECIPNPYPRAALLIADDLDEQGRWSDGLTYLDRALTFDPNFAPARAERGAALNALHRYGDAAENNREALSGVGSSLDPMAEGVLLRGEGYALTELGRLDEAEAAYRQALKVDPGHGHAGDELIYIARLKAGGKTAPSYFDSQVHPNPKTTPPSPPQP